MLVLIIIRMFRLEGSGRYIVSEWLIVILYTRR